MPEIVLIKTGQNGYSPKQVANEAMTVGELIHELSRYDPDDAVVVGGYGRGAIWEPARRVQEFEEFEDD